MTSIASIPAASSRIAGGLSPVMARGLMAAVIATAAAAGLAGIASPASSLAVAHAGADLTRVLRFMAALKALIAVAAGAAVFWRLGAGITLPWFAAYAASCGAMAAGPGVIWAMAHVGLGALLLHGGLIATILLLCRDRGTVGRMAAILARR